mmetsp:Transcript_29242/g.80336  ORF Transcript_29242/g.80336 Transcript_29242/m.80336 type:complete len:214 (-) Transcript_29242:53-694(-)
MSRQKRSAKFSITIPSAPAKKANTMDKKCLSLSDSFSCQSDRSADKSISSAVQKEATCCLYMDHKSECSMGNNENRESLSSEQMGSTKVLLFFLFAVLWWLRSWVSNWGRLTDVTLSEPPRKRDSFSQGILLLALCRNVGFENEEAVISAIAKFSSLGRKSKTQQIRKRWILAILKLDSPCATVSGVFALCYYTAARAVSGWMVVVDWQVWYI